jgi:peptide/nickel transport system ATP-binding protein
LLCDEPVSSLDVSVQAQILNLLLECKARFALTMLFIAHDLAVVRHISDRIAVMYLGRICEILPASMLTAQAAHPYTQLLLASVPNPHPRRRYPRPESAPQAAATPLAPPMGCRFRIRCPLASERCATEQPQLREIRPNHQVACHHVD